MVSNETFVKAFEEAWREPATRFAKLFHPDGALYQQGMERPLRRDEIPDHIPRVLARFPDLTVTPIHWAVNGDVVLIEWSAARTFRGVRAQWQGASRFTLRDGLIIEEVAYFDTAPLRALTEGLGNPPYGRPQ